MARPGLRLSFSLSTYFMNTRDFARSWSQALLGLCLLSAAPLAAAEPAQVIVILADSLGMSELSLSGNPQPGTPGIDALAASGITLTDHHGGALVTTGRAMFHTGQHPWQAGVWGDSSGRDRLAGGKGTLARVFGAGGLQTALMGTWGLGDAAPCRARDHGFTYSLTHGGAVPGSSADAWGNDGTDDLWLENGSPVKTTGTGMDAAFAAGTAYVQARRSGPFLCIIAPPAISGPRGEQVAALDKAVAAFLRHLTGIGMHEATVILTAACGPQEAGQGLRGQAGGPYENAHRVPCLIRHRGLKPRALSTLTTHADLLPTLAGLCAVPVPPDYALTGQDLGPLLRGESPAGGSRVLMVEAQDTPQPVPYRLTSVMEDRWRLINGRELYDVQLDPAQRRDVAADSPDIVQRLRSAYDDWWKKRPTLAPSRLLAAHGEPVLLCPAERSGTTAPAMTLAAVVSGQSGSGPWLLQVPNESACTIILRSRPPGAPNAECIPSPLPARAILRTGTDEEWQTLTEKSVAASTTSGITFQRCLPAGLVSLDAYWADAQGNLSAVPYMEIRPVEEVRPAVPAAPATPATTGESPPP